MPTVAAGIAALFSSGGKFAHLTKKGAELIRTAESSPSALARFDETSAAATAEMLKDSYAAVKALVAQALDRDPSHAEVDAVFAEVADHPNAPFRFHRLFGEARKSASRRRRRFLASVLFGLEFSKIPDDDRDRVDMAAERMTVADVEFLARVSAMRRRSETHRYGDGKSFIFGPDGIGALIDGTTLRIVTPDDWQGDGFASDVFEDARFIGDRAALASLVSLGCLDLRDAVLNAAETGKVYDLRILPLGDLLLRALEEIRVGFAAAE
jgi:hypothetical protein